MKGDDRLVPPIPQYEHIYLKLMQPGRYVAASVILNTQSGPPAGEGFAFYREVPQDLVPVLGKYQYITYRVTLRPVLGAVNQQQLDVWKGWDIVATPVVAIKLGGGSQHTRMIREVHKDELTYE